MYDVIYIDGDGTPQRIASDLSERGDACALARSAAAERGAGRMVADRLTGVAEERCRNTVLVVQALREAA